MFSRVYPFAKKKKKKKIKEKTNNKQKTGAFPLWLKIVILETRQKPGIPKVIKLENHLLGGF